MRTKTIFLTGVLLISACMPMVETSTPLPPPTQKQSYYAADRDYEAVLKIAIAYKDQCFSTPDQFQGDCRDIVNSLRRVNREAQEVRERADIAIRDDDRSTLSEAADHLEALRDKLRQELEVQMLLNGQQPKTLE